MASDTDQYGTLGAEVFAGLGLCPYVNIDTAVDLMTSCLDVLSDCSSAIWSRISTAFQDRTLAFRSRLRRGGGGGGRRRRRRRIFTTGSDSSGAAASGPRIEPVSVERSDVELPPSYAAALTMSAPESSADRSDLARSTTRDNGSRLYRGDSSTTNRGTEPSSDCSTGDLERYDRNRGPDRLPSYSEAVGMIATAAVPRTPGWGGAMNFYEDPANYQRNYV